MEKKQKKKYIQIVILSVAFILFAISMIFTSYISRGIKSILYKADIRVDKSDMIVHFIDVGQGDAIAINFPNGKIMLIDTGPKSSQNNLVKYIRNEVIKSNNLKEIDYIILTHPDADHSGGLSAVFSEFNVKNFYRPNIASLSENSDDFVISTDTIEYDEAIKLSKTHNNLDVNIINKNYSFYVGDVEVKILSPLKTYSTTNEMSAVIQVSYLNKKFLFTGDIQGGSEMDMLNEYGESLKSDVLKVAHHGSDNATDYRFIQMVNPKYAVICVGSNIHGHPSLNTIIALENIGAKVLTTKDNSVRIVCGNDKFGTLNSKVVQSYEFVDWWIIALLVDVIILLAIVNNVFKLVKQKKLDEEKLK